MNMNAPAKAINVYRSPATKPKTRSNTDTRAIIFHPVPC